MSEPITIPVQMLFTICFCICEGEVLMLYRNRPPNQYLWNGLGGKIEAGETPDQAIKREIKEEAGFDLTEATTITYAGEVTWEGVEENNKNKGMYCYIAEFPKNFITWIKKSIAEGELEWKSLEWACDRNNSSIAPNVPALLPSMLAESKPKRYNCIFSGSDLKNVIKTDLTQN